MRIFLDFWHSAAFGFLGLGGLDGRHYFGMGTGKEHYGYISTDIEIIGGIKEAI